jgi:hypothetical protein
MSMDAPGPERMLGEVRRGDHLVDEARELWDRDQLRFTAPLQHRALALVFDRGREERVLGER